MAKVRCFHCSTLAEFSDRLGLREECAKCGWDLHVCLNCSFYDRGSYNECRESSAEVVLDKEKRNHCDHFVPSADGVGSKGPTKEDLQKAAESLFKKSLR